MFKLAFLSRGKKRSPKSETVHKENVRLIFGLGNPDQKYKLTYHNAGHIYVDSLTQDSFSKYRDFVFTKDGDLIFAKNTTYMNASGRAVRQALKYFNLQPNQLMVAHDDSDLPIGEHKIDFGRGSAGHNGVNSVIKALGTKDFFRLRIGVRGQARGKAGDFVLKPMSQADLAALKEALEQIALQ